MPPLNHKDNEPRELFKLVALACLAIVIYMPTLRSGFFIFDDFGIVNSIKSIPLEGQWPFLWKVEGRYWRPIVMLSFMLDVHLFKANSAFMHLHNILLHAGNTLLVFYIVKHIRFNDKSTIIPVLGATLFAIHPINTESVSWIAGRTDLYAALFSLAGILYFFRAIHEKSIYFSWISAFFILFGCLAKETPFTLFPAVLFAIFLYKKTYERTDSAIKKSLSALPFFLVGASYLLLRDKAFQTTDQSIEKVVNTSTATATSYLEHAHEGLTALGFYIKKVLFPFPLNFAIDHVNPFFLWVGVTFLFFLCFILHRRSIGGILLIFMLATIAPALINAVFHIAWTPFAERYLYIPAAFMCIYLMTIIPWTNITSLPRIMLLTSLFLPMLFGTVYRNLQWMNSEEILADATQKNPENISLRINHAIVLDGTEGPLAAREELRYAMTKAPKRQEIRRLMASFSIDSLNDLETARDDLSVFFDGTQEPDEKTLSMMVDVNKKRLQKRTVELPIIHEELFRAYKSLYYLTEDVSYLNEAIKNVTNNREQKESIRLLNEIINRQAITNSSREAAKESLRIISEKKSEP